jgi:hypothetical protein
MDLDHARRYPQCPCSASKARLADLGDTALVDSPTDFGRLIAEGTEKWGKIILAAHIKAE